MHDLQTAMLTMSMERAQQQNCECKQEQSFSPRDDGENNKETLQDVTHTQPNQTQLCKSPSEQTVVPLAFASICDLDCTCRCHVMVVREKPNIVRDIVNWAVAGSYISSWLAQGCDSRDCRRRSSVRYAYTYSLPWFFMTQRKLFFIWTASSAQGPEFCLRFPRVRPSYDQIFLAALKGYLPVVRQALEAGTASVIDTDPHGVTPLLVQLPSMRLRQS